MSKRKFVVEVREVHVSYREIEAESLKEAIDKAGDLGKEVALEYSHTLDKDTWTVTEFDEKGEQVGYYDDLGNDVDYFGNIREMKSKEQGK